MYFLSPMQRCPLAHIIQNVYMLSSCDKVLNIVTPTFYTAIGGGSWSQWSQASSEVITGHFIQVHPYVAEDVYVGFAFALFKSKACLVNGATAVTMQDMLHQNHIFF